LHKKKYIYEIDFKSYFDRVDNISVLDYLERKGMPGSWLSFLEKVNRTPITLLEEDKIDESDHRERLAIREKFTKGLKAAGLFDKLPQADKETLSYHFHPFFHDNPKLNELGFSGNPSGGDPFLNDLYGKLYASPLGEVGCFGLPQGAPTSPILANVLALDFYGNCRMKGIDIVMYADDAVLFSDEPIEPLLDELIIFPHGPRNLEYAKEKCGYVKFDGKEIKPLVFLGLCLEKNFVRAHTRRGSRLGVGPREELLGELFYELHDKVQELSIEAALDLLENTIETHRTYPLPTNSMEKLFQGKLAGFIISRLQAGS
jgi:hypothetical protein